MINLTKGKKLVLQKKKGEKKEKCITHVDIRIFMQFLVKKKKEKERKSMRR